MREAHVRRGGVTAVASGTVIYMSAVTPPR